jgi:hypothetical protein
MKYKISIQFGGFYGSYHEATLDSLVEEYIGNIEDVSSDVWHELMVRYSKAWLDEFNDIFGTSLEFDVLWQPSYYNYDSDEIIAIIDSSDIRKLIRQARKNEPELIKYLKYITESRDGYISFYTYEDLFHKCNIEILIQHIITYLIKSDVITPSEIEVYDLLENYIK